MRHMKKYILHCGSQEVCRLDFKQTDYNRLYCGLYILWRRIFLPLFVFFQTIKDATDYVFVSVLYVQLA